MKKTLLNSQTVLGELNYKSSLYVLFAFLMPDCPKPCPTSWLADACKLSEPTVRGACRHLRKLELVQEFERTGKKYWLLVKDNFYQLALPFQQLAGSLSLAGSAGSLQSGNMSGSLSANGQSSLFDANEKKIFPSDQRKNFSDGSQKDALVVEEKIFFKHCNGYKLDHDDDDLNNNNLDHSSSSVHLQKNIFSSPTAEYLSLTVGLDSPVPEKFSHLPLPFVMAHWWVTQLRSFRSPQGWVRTRLENGHQPQVVGILNLAEQWVSMPQEDKQYLLSVALGVDNEGFKSFASPKRGAAFADRLDEDFYPDLGENALDVCLKLANYLWDLI